MNRPDLFMPDDIARPPLAVGEREAARLLGVSSRTLFNWRATGRGPRFVRAGARILYATDALRQWLTDAAGDSAVMPAEQGKISADGQRDRQGGGQ